MIPLNYSFGQHEFGILQRQNIQGTPAAINVSAKAKAGPKTVRLTLASDPLVSLWISGMKAMLRTSGNTNIDSYTIDRIDHTNKYLYLICKNPAEIVDNANIANVIQWGICPGTTEPGTKIFNNNKVLIAEKYEVDGYFVIKKSRKNEAILFQVINLDTITGITNAKVEYSLNGVDWANFAVAKETGPLELNATGNAYTGIILIDEAIECWLRLFVDCNDSEYYVMAR